MRKVLTESFYYDQSPSPTQSINEQCWRGLLLSGWYCLASGYQGPSTWSWNPWGLITFHTREPHQGLSKVPQLFSGVRGVASYPCIYTVYICTIYKVGTLRSIWYNSVRFGKISKSELLERLEYNLVRKLQSYSVDIVREPHTALTHCQYTDRVTLSW